MEYRKIKKVIKGGLVSTVDKKKDFIQYAKVVALMKRIGVKI